MKKILAALTSVIILIVITVFPAGATSSPKTFCLYYGYPSCVNGLYNNEKVAQLFSKYDIVVFGDGLEFTSHADHNNTVSIIARMKKLNSDIQVFGYVPIGMGTHSQCLTDAQISARITAWKNTGATGIFLDEFGYDYKVTRTRQNSSVTYAHNLGMNVIANSWNYEWCFAKSNIYLDWIKFNGNPSNLAPVLNSNDYFLFENMFCGIDDNGNYVQSSDRTLLVHQYYTSIKSDYGKSYYNKFGTKTIALDGISSSWANKQQLYNISYSTSKALNIHVYGASTRNWGAGYDFVDYLP